MTTNEKIFEQWYNQIAQIPELGFKQTQLLTIKMNNALNETEREEIREKLINGTLYLVFREIKKYLIGLNGSQFDIEDIISEAINEWISVIDSSKVLSVLSFQQLFRSNFYGSLSDRIVPDKMAIYTNFGINYMDVSILLSEFIELKNNNENLSIAEFSEYLLHNSQYEKYYWKLTSEKNIKKYYNLFDLFNAIYESLTKDKDGKVATPPKSILFFTIHLFINSAYYNYSPNIKDIVCEDPTQKIDQELFDEYIPELVKQCNLPDYKTMVLIKHLGLDGEEPMTLEELAKNCNKSNKMMGKYKREVIARLKRKPEIKKMYHK